MIESSNLARFPAGAREDAALDRHVGCTIEIAVFFPSRQPLPDDHFSEFRIGLDHLSFMAPSKEALQELAERLIAVGAAAKGVEQFAPIGNWYVAFRDPDNIQLEYWLPGLK